MVTQMAIRTRFSLARFQRAKKRAGAAAAAATDKRATAEAMDRRFCEVMRGKAIRRDTGRMEESLTRPDHPDHIMRETAEGVEIGTRVEYAQRYEGEFALTEDEKRYIGMEVAREAMREALKGGGGG